MYRAKEQYWARLKRGITFLYHIPGRSSNCYLHYTGRVMNNGTLKTIDIRGFWNEQGEEVLFSNEEFDGVENAVYEHWRNNHEDILNTE